MRKDNRRHIVDIRKDYFFRITQRSGEKAINKQTHLCIVSPLKAGQFWKLI